MYWKIFWTINLIFVFIVRENKAQNSTSLESSIQKAINEAPSSMIYDLSKSEKDLAIKSLNTKYLPQVSLGAQATYQSETTGLDINFPGVSIPRLTKDQYKIQLDANQVLYDGGVVSTHKHIKKIASDQEIAQADIDIEMIREQIIQVYFAILETQSRIEILDLKKADLIAVQKKMEVGVENGVILKSELNQLLAEQISVGQMQDEIKYIRNNQIQILNQLTHQNLDINTTFETPTQILNNAKVAISKPTLTLLDLQKAQLSEMRNLDKSLNRPRLSLFAQGGYGKPGLNFLKNEFTTYYITGLKLQWNLASLYTNTKDNAVNLLQKDKVEVKRKAFLQQLEIKIATQQNEIVRLNAVMPTDLGIIALRSEIKKIAAIQVENGTKTTSDFILKLNDENEALLNHRIHEIQAIKSSYLLQHHLGNY